MTLEPRVSLITLGVENVAAATAFYERIGFSRSRGASTGEISFFPLSGGLVLGLYGRAALAADARIEDQGESGFSGITLAYNTRTELETDKLVAAFVAAGAQLVKSPEKTFWGGYSGYVADPDGHLWEIAFNPHWPIGADGGLTLPD